MTNMNTQITQIINNMIDTATTTSLNPNAKEFFPKGLNPYAKTFYPTLLINSPDSLDMFNLDDKFAELEYEWRSFEFLSPSPSPEYRNIRLDNIPKAPSPSLELSIVPPPPNSPKNINIQVFNFGW